MRRALLCVLVAVGAGLLCYRLAAPLFAASANAPPLNVSQPSDSLSPTSSAASASPDPMTSAAPADAPVLAAPRTEQQRAYDTLEAQRSSYYTWLSANFATMLKSARPNRDDQATLDLYATVNDNRIVARLLSSAVQPDAYRYGFRHIRFFLPNPEPEMDRYTLAAEAEPDAGGVWQAFRK